MKILVRNRVVQFTCGGQLLVTLLRWPPKPIGKFSCKPTVAIVVQLKTVQGVGLLFRCLEEFL